MRRNLRQSGPSLRLWKAIPRQQESSERTTGPPEFPGFIAASIYATNYCRLDQITITWILIVHLLSIRTGMIMFNLSAYTVL